MSLEKLRKINDHIKIEDANSESFLKYGKIIDGYDFKELEEYMEKETGVPENGNIYIASDLKMENTKLKEILENEFYGEMPIEIGYCNGKNSKLNGLEFHKGSEINIAVTDFILLLGHLKDIRENKYDSSKIEAFYIKKGTAIQLYETTLHLSPCKVLEEGFKCIVILPKGTNEPLKNDKGNYRDKILLAKNKWLIAHPEGKLLIEKGAYVGIYGEQIVINTQSKV